MTHERGTGEACRPQRIDLPPGQRADREPPRPGRRRPDDVRDLRVCTCRLHGEVRDHALRVRERPCRSAPLCDRLRPRVARVRLGRRESGRVRRGREARRPRGGAGGGNGPEVLTHCGAVTVAHWDEVEPHHSARGEMDVTWQRLGNAAGTRGVGVSRVRVAPGKLPTPPHSHTASEELYFVLAGSGLAWQDGDVHVVRPLDCVIHRPGEMEHTFVAGPDGLEFLVFGTRHPTEIGWLPRSRAIRPNGPWVEGRDDSPWDIEATVEPLEYGEPAPRPENIVNVEEVEHERFNDSATTAPLATRERSILAGLHWEKIGAGHRGCVPHCHSAEEEVFVMLEGSAMLELWQREGGVEETPLRAGHLVARP